MAKNQVIKVFDVSKSELLCDRTITIMRYGRFYRSEEGIVECLDCSNYSFPISEQEQKKAEIYVITLHINESSENCSYSDEIIFWQINNKPYSINQDVLTDYTAKESMEFSNFKGVIQKYGTTYVIYNSFYGKCMFSIGEISEEDSIHKCFISSESKKYIKFWTTEEAEYIFAQDDLGNLSAKYVFDKCDIYDCHQADEEYIYDEKGEKHKCDERDCFFFNNNLYFSKDEIIIPLPYADKLEVSKLELHIYGVNDKFVLIFTNKNKCLYVENLKTNKSYGPYDVEETDKDELVKNLFFLDSAESVEERDGIECVDCKVGTPLPFIQIGGVLYYVADGDLFKVADIPVENKLKSIKVPGKNSDSADLGYFIIITNENGESSVYEYKNSKVTEYTPHEEK